MCTYMNKLVTCELWYIYEITQHNFQQKEDSKSVFNVKIKQKSLSFPLVGQKLSNIGSDKLCLPGLSKINHQKSVIDIVGRQKLVLQTFFLDVMKDLISFKQ